MTGPLRIAVADDEQDIRDYYSRILPRLGHHVVVVASTGAELVAQSRTARPELVITDVKMPDMNGIEAARCLWRDENVPVILVSANHDPALLPGANDHNIVGYLLKPIKLSDLGPLIVQAMLRFEELQELRKTPARQSRRAAN